MMVIDDHHYYRGTTEDLLNDPDLWISYHISCRVAAVTVHPTRSEVPEEFLRLGGAWAETACRYSGVRLKKKKPSD